MSHLAKAPCTPSGHEKVDEIDKMFCTICPVESGTRSLATDPLSPVCCQVGFHSIVTRLSMFFTSPVADQYTSVMDYECPFYPNLMKQKFYRWC